MELIYRDRPNFSAPILYEFAGAQPFSKPEHLRDGVPEPVYATLEQAGWPLDGSCRIMSDYGPSQWWSECLSDEDGVMAQPPAIVLVYPEPVSVSGLEFRFHADGDQWCTRLEVAWYKGAQLRLRQILQPQAGIWRAEQPVEDFDRLEIRLLQINKPGQFAKFSQVICGLEWRFSGELLQQVRRLQQMDPTLRQLNTDTYEIRVCTQGKVLLPMEGQWAWLKRKDMPQAALVVSGFTMEEPGVYTLQLKSEPNIFNQRFMGGIYQNVPAYEFIRTLLPEIPVDMDPELDAVPISGYLPVCTRRQALQQVAFVLGAQVQANAETVTVTPVRTWTTGSLPAEQIFLGEKLEGKPICSQIELVSHNYIPETYWNTLIKDEPVPIMEQMLLTFNRPYAQYDVTGAEVLDSGPNFLQLLIMDPQMTILARPYTHMETVHTRENRWAAAAGSNRILRVDDATLVTGENVNRVLDRLGWVARLHHQLTADCVVTDQQAGDVVETVEPSGKEFYGYVTRLEQDITPVDQTGRVTVLGKEAYVWY